MPLIQWLNQFGLTNQEASIYITLQTEGVLTGYEVSKLTGISRSNAYTSLANLTEKGAANLIEGEKKLYVSVPIEDFCASRIRRLQKTGEELCRNMPARKEEYQGYLTIQGRENIIDTTINMILKAEQRIYLSLPETIKDELKEPLLSAIEKGLKVVIITDRTVDFPGAIVYETEKALEEIRLITDSREVITGDVADGTSTSLYSSKRNLVQLLKESLTNEIELIRIRGVKK